MDLKEETNDERLMRNLLQLTLNDQRHHEMLIKENTPKVFTN